MIEALDIDGIRIDKATQINVAYGQSSWTRRQDASTDSSLLFSAASWSNSTRTCARKFNKNNFYIPGEVTGGDTFGSLYM